MFLAASVATRRAPLKHHRGARRRIPTRRSSRFADTLLVQTLDLIASACASAPDADGKEADASTFAAFWSARAPACFLDTSLTGEEDDAAEDSDGGGCCGGLKEAAAQEAPVLLDNVSNPVIAASDRHQNIDEELFRSFDQLLQVHQTKECSAGRRWPGFATYVALEPSLALFDSESDDDDTFPLTENFDSEDDTHHTRTDFLLSDGTDELDAYLFSSKIVLAEACNSQITKQDVTSRLRPVEQGSASQAMWVGPGPSLTCDAISLCARDIPAQASDIIEVADHIDCLDEQLVKGFTMLSQMSHEPNHHSFACHRNPASHICRIDPRPSPSLDLHDSDSDRGYSDEMEDEDFYGDIDVSSQRCDNGGEEL